MAKTYYVVVGIHREFGDHEMINGFYDRQDAADELDCCKHTHKCLRIIKTDDTQSATSTLIQQLRSA
jgi:hypothetical protein